MKLRLLSYLVATLLAASPAQAQSQPLLGAGKPSAAAPADCSAFLPANFATSALYISWTTADGLGSFGMACLNGTTPVAASTLGTISGSGSVGASGLVLTGGFFQFSNVAWLAQNSGTMYVNLAMTSVSGAHHVFNVSDGTTANVLLIRAVGAPISGALTLANATTTAASGFSATINTPFKAAYSYVAGAQIIYINGTNTGTSSAAGVAPTLNTSNLGSGVGGAFPVPGTITQTAFFSTALNAGTTPTLQAITQ